MAKNKITKEDLKSPDAFLSFADKTGQALSENWKPIAGVLAVFLLGGIGYTTMTAMNRAQEQAAGEALFEVEQKISDVKTEYSKKQQESVKDLLDKAEENEKEIEARLKELPELDFDKDFASLTQQVEQVISQHESTQSAQMARIRLARLYIDYEKLDMAEAVLRPAAAQSEKGSSVYGLSRTLLASVLSHKGQMDEAIATLSQILDDQSLSYLHSEVLLKLGVLNKEAGNPDRAEEMFRRVTTEYGNTEAGKTAKNFLKMIRFLSPKAEAESNNASAIDL